MRSIWTARSTFCYSKYRCAWVFRSRNDAAARVIDRFVLANRWLFFLLFINFWACICAGVLAIIIFLAHYFSNICHRCRMPNGRAVNPEINYIFVRWFIHVKNECSLVGADVCHRLQRRIMSIAFYVHSFGACFDRKIQIALRIIYQKE